MCQAIGAPALAQDARFKSNDLRNENHAALTAEMERALKAKPAQEWLVALEAAGVPCGPINDVAQVLADPHVQSRNMVVTMEDADAGTLKLAGNPMKLSAFADPKTRPPAPKLDEKGGEIRANGFKAIAD
jgi:CoA:oxalate CoA-transferase